MMRRSISAWLFVLTSLVTTPARAEEPLPAGAVARLGTHAWRHGHTVAALDWSPDGQWVASASWDKTSRVWDASSGREIARIKLPEAGSAVAIAPDKSAIAVGYMKRGVLIWDPTSGKEIRRIEGNENTPFHLRFSPDGQRLVWTAGRMIRVWDAAAWKEIRVVHPEPKNAERRPLAISTDARRAATVRDREIDLWDLESGERTKTVSMDDRPAQALALNRDGSSLAAVSGDGVVLTFDLAKGAVVQRVDATRIYDENWKIAFAGDKDQWIVGAGHDGTMCLIDRAEGRIVDRVLISGRNDLWAMALSASADGKWLATGTTDKAIRLWDLSAGKLGRTDFGHGSTISSAVFVDGGKKVATASEDGQVLVWEAASGKRTGRLEGAGTVGLQIAADAAGRLIAVSDENPGLVIFDGTTLRPTAAVKDRLVAMHNVAVSPDGSIVAAVERHATVRMIDARTGAERTRFTLNPRQYAEIPLAISPDNRLVAVGSGDPDKDKDLVRLMDAGGGHEIKVLPVGAGSKLNGDAYGAISWSPDGAMIAVAAWGKPIEFWEIATAQRRCKVEGDGDAGTCIAFSPDGKWLAAGGGPDKPTVRVWEVASGRMAAKFTGHRDWLKRVAWSSDSSKLLSCGSDTTAYVWDVAAATKALAQLVEEDLDGGRVESDVAALGDADAANAWVAMRTLAARRHEAVNALAQAIKVVEEVPGDVADAAALAELIKRLDADAFAERESAAAQLARLGESAGPAMRGALRTVTSDEVRARLTILLGRLSERGPTSPEALRARRGIEVLERLATPAAREVLERLARERPGSVLSGLAKGALGRMSTGR